MSWSSRAADAPFPILKRIWRVLAPSGATPVTKDLAHYRQLERCLWMTRWRHAGEESAEEDPILDEMEEIWLNLAVDERSLLRLEGPRCWPTDSSSLPPDLAATLYVPAETPWAYKGFHSPGEAIQSEEAA
jgi:hypothetical protein